MAWITLVAEVINVGFGHGFRDRTAGARSGLLPVYAITTLAVAITIYPQVWYYKFKYTPIYSSTVTI